MTRLSDHESTLLWGLLAIMVFATCAITAVIVWPQVMQVVEALAHLGLSGILLLAVIWLSRLCRDLRSYLRSTTSVNESGGRPTS